MYKMVEYLDPAELLSMQALSKRFYKKDVLKYQPSYRLTKDGVHWFNNPSDIRDNSALYRFYEKNGCFRKI